MKTISSRPIAALLPAGPAGREYDSGSTETRERFRALYAEAREAAR